MLCVGVVRLPHYSTEGEAEVLQLFYDEFQKHTKAYKSDVYSFETFKAEYYMMCHVVRCGISV